MKSKKLIIAVVALTMSATSALAFSACHKHEYNWEVTRAATCTTEGEKTGTCDCGDTKKEVIEVIAHSYGEWVITKPTETAVGQAVKSCATDSEHAHDIEVELPELGDEAYTVTEGDDVDTYTLANTNGEITFTVEKVKDIVVKVTVSEDDLIADGEDEEFGGYGKEFSFTTEKAGKYTLTLSTEVEGAYSQVYESRAAFEAWGAPLVENGSGYDADYGAGDERTLFLFTDTAGEYTLTLSVTKPTAYTAAVKGGNEVTLEASEMRNLVDNLFVFEGEPSKKYVVSFDEGTQNNPFMSAVTYINEYSYEVSDNTAYFEDDNYMVITADANGKAYFSLYTYAEGVYSFTVADYVYIPVSAIEFKDDDGNDLTEYTLYIGSSYDDYGLASKFVAMPKNASNKKLTFSIEDGTVASYVDKICFRGLKEGTTKLTVKANAGTANEISKVITLKVVEKVNSLNVGDNVFDWNNENGSLPNQPTKYRFVGTANTKYVVTFAKTIGFAWTIADASDEKNYIDMNDTKITYLEVTADAEGKAELVISGTQCTGTLSIVLASEFEYPDVGGGEDGPATDLDGRYIVKEGVNNGYTFGGAQQKYFVFDGDANTAYTVTLSQKTFMLGQCDESGEWLKDGDGNNLAVFNVDDTTDNRLFVVTTDANGVAYIRINTTSSGVDNMTLNIKKGAVDEHGHAVLNEGANEGIAVGGSQMNRYFAFKGEANYNYNVTLSQEVHFVDACDSAGNWLDKTHEKSTCVITTDKNGVAHIRITSFNAVELTVTIVKGEAATPETPDPDPTPDPTPSETAPVISAPVVDITETGTASYTIGNEEPFDNEDEWKYYRAFTFTAEEGGEYTITVESGDVLFLKEDFDKYYDSSVTDFYNYGPIINEISGGTVSLELTAGKVYTFVAVVEGGEHTISIVKG